MKKSQLYICNKCKMICEGKDDLNKHISNGHCDGDTNTSRNVVCRFYRQGHCRFGDMCKFAHVGYSNIHQNPRNYIHNSNRKEPCRNGNNCRWNKNNTCKFSHDTIRFSSQINTQLFNTQSESQGRCWEQNSCKRSYCKFSHDNQEDFPKLDATNRRS